MIIDSSIMFNCISAFCLIIATVLSYRNYKLIKTIENENHFYKQKMDSYPEIIKASYKLVNDFEKFWFEFKEDEEFDFEKFEVKYLQSINLYRQSVIENVLFLPTDLINEIENFYDKILDKSEVKTTDEEIDIFLDEWLDVIEHIANLMRKDINLEPINRKLKARTLK